MALYNRIQEAIGRAPSGLPHAIWEDILGLVGPMVEDEPVYSWHHVVAQQCALLEAGRKITEVAAETDTIACSICLDTIRQGLRCYRLPCGHLFHGGCITQWLQNHTKCPNCNFNLLTNAWGQ
jgi:hypothetical protein